MKKGTVLLTLTSTLLMLALVAAAQAQPGTVGVVASNTFTYGVTASWSSNDPSASPPTSWQNVNETQWMQVAVDEVSGTNITGETITHYVNGTETIRDGWVDLYSGTGSLAFFIISANLVKGDWIYLLATATVTDIVPRTYSGGARNTDYLSLNSSSGTQTVYGDFYWDEPTGALVEFLQKTVTQNGAYTTTSTTHYQITGSNVWTVPEFSTWAPPVITLIAVTSAAVIVAKQKRLRPLD